tara:strand:+ start:248 stop:502 length:255 start_codon:yes stop_codon:yes gene_type:complete
MRAAKIYNIININDLELIDFKQVFESNIETVRKSLDENKFVIKYNTTPTFIKDETVEPLQVLSYSECYELMQTSEWSEIEETND